MNSYFTFGQRHEHTLNDITLGKDHIIVIESASSNEARELMFKTFGTEWAFQYDDKPPELRFFPKGIINIKDFL